MTEEQRMILTTNELSHIHEKKEVPPDFPRIVREDEFLVVTFKASQSGHEVLNVLSALTVMMLRVPQWSRTA